MIKKILLSVGMLVVAMPLNAYAIEDNAGADVQVKIDDGGVYIGGSGVPEVRVNDDGVKVKAVPPARPVIKEAREAVKEVRKETKDNIKEIREESKEKRVDIRVQMQADIQARQAKMVEARTEMKAKMEAQKAEREAKLAKFKDEKKAKTVERVNNKLNELNTKMTGEMTVQLTKMSDLIVRISEHADKSAAVGGVNVDVVRADITAAQTAIATAQAAVTAQAAISYSVTLTTEDKARADVEAVNKKLRADLEAVQMLVKTAREAVRKAATDLGSIVKAKTTGSTEVKVEGANVKVETEGGIKVEINN